MSSVATLDTEPSAVASGRARRAVYLYGGMAVRIAATMALIPLLGRALGPSAYGVYAVANSLMLVVWQLVEFGIPLVASRCYAQARDERGRDEAMTIATWARLALVPLALAAGAGMAAFSPALQGEWGVAMLAALLGVQSGMNYGWLLTARGAARMQSALETMPAIATLLLCAALVRDADDIATVFIAMNLAALVANGVAWRHARRHARLRRTSATELFGAVMAGRAALAYRVGFIALGSGTPYLLSSVAATDATGHYAMADRLLSAAAGLLQPLAVAAFPDSMRLFAEAPARAAALYARFALKVMAGAAVVALGVAVLGPWLIPQVLGRQYVESVPILVTLIAALPMMALSQMVVSCILYPLHEDVAIAVCYGLGLVAMCAGTWTLVGTHGVPAAAALRVAVETVMALGLAGWAWRSVRRRAASGEGAGA